MLAVFVMENMSPPYMLAGLDAMMLPFTSYTFIVPSRGNEYLPTFSVAIPDVTDALERTCPDEPMIFIVTAFDGLFVTLIFSLVVE